MSGEFDRLRDDPYLPDDDRPPCPCAECKEAEAMRDAERERQYIETYPYGNGGA